MWRKVLLQVSAVIIIACHPGQAQQQNAMVLIPGGNFQPFLQEQPGKKVYVPDFTISTVPVTNAQYLEFVKANPQWAKSRVKPIFADRNYLQHWKSDEDPGDEVQLQAPVTNVSWFAAKAYTQWKNQRLPVMNEWEYAAAIPPAGKHQGIPLEKIILEWYSKPTPRVLPPVTTGYVNTAGIYDMYGLVWEWVDDFNNLIMSNDSRSNEVEKKFVCGAGALNAADTRDYAAFMRYAFRNSLKANYTVKNLGFRCAADTKKINK